MNLYEHCNLCDNLKTSLQDGMTCRLTDKKPLFSKTCSKILLGEEFKNRIGLIHIKIEGLKKKKASIYIYSFLYLIIGCLLIISQRNLLVEFDFDYIKYRRSSGNLLLIFLGFGLIGLAYNKLNQHRKKTKTVTEEKNKIDAILNKYQIKYSCNVEFGRKYHGNQDVIVELKSNNNLLKDSKRHYQI